MAHAKVINNHQSPFIGPIKIDLKCENGGPKMKLLISFVLVKKNPEK